MPATPSMRAGDGSGPIGAGGCGGEGRRRAPETLLGLPRAASVHSPAATSSRGRRCACRRGSWTVYRLVAIPQAALGGRVVHRLTAIPPALRLTMC